MENNRSGGPGSIPGILNFGYRDSGGCRDGPFKTEKIMALTHSPLIAFLRSRPNPIPRNCRSPQIQRRSASRRYPPGVARPLAPALVFLRRRSVSTGRAAYRVRKRENPTPLSQSDAARNRSSPLVGSRALIRDARVREGTSPRVRPHPAATSPRLARQKDPRLASRSARERRANSSPRCTDRRLR